jgi:hypothetical protein
MLLCLFWNKWLYFGHNLKVKIMSFSTAHSSPKRSKLQKSKHCLTYWFLVRLSLHMYCRYVVISPRIKHSGWGRTNTCAMIGGIRLGEISPTYRVIVYFGQFFYTSSPIFWKTFLHNKKYVLIFAKYGEHVGRLFHKFTFTYIHKFCLKQSLKSAIIVFTSANGAVLNLGPILWNSISAENFLDNL